MHNVKSNIYIGIDRTTKIELNITAFNNGNFYLVGNVFVNS